MKSRFLLSFLGILVICFGSSCKKTEAKFQNLFPYRQSQHWGFITREGEVVIPAKYFSVNDFRLGYAVVQGDDFNFGLIDSNGQEILPLIFSSLDFIDTNSILVSKTPSNKSYLIDIHQNVQIPPLYDLLVPQPENGNFSFKIKDSVGLLDPQGDFIFGIKEGVIDTYQSGRIAVSDRLGIGFLDRLGNWAIERQYEDATNFDHGTAFAFNHDSVFYIDTAGTILYSFYQPSLFFTRVAINRIAIETDSCYLMCDEKGNILASDFDCVGVLYSEGYLEVMKDSLWGYIDTSGNLRIPYSFDASYGFMEGLAVSKNKATNSMGFVDTQGKWAISPLYRDCRGFENGIGAVSLWPLDHNPPKWYFIRRNGQLITELPCDNIMGFKNNLAQVVVDGKIAYVDTLFDFVWKEQ
jgi:WG containing repeat